MRSAYNTSAATGASTEAAASGNVSQDAISRQRGVLGHSPSRCAMRESVGCRTPPGGADLARGVPEDPDLQRALKALR